jgi:hypothetical protein
MFDVTFSADTTLELRLRPLAFRLPPEMLPVALTTLAVTLVVLTLPPVILPVALTTVPVMLVAETLPPVMLPCADISPGVVILLPAMSPETFKALTTLPLKLAPVEFK